MLNKDKIISRVQKLLAMSEDTGSPHEAAIAAKRAAKLMQQYNLDNASVLLSTLTDNDLTENTVDSAAGQRIPKWIMHLLIPVAELHDCKVRYVHSPYGKAPQFVGVKEDAMVAGYVFEYLVGELKRLARLYQPLNKAYGRGAKGMNDFKEGASSEVRATLREMQADKTKAERVHSTGTELVVCKQQLIEAHYNIRYRKGGRSTYRDSDARQTGKEAGAGVSIRDALTGGSKPIRIA